MPAPSHHRLIVALLFATLLFEAGAVRPSPIAADDPSPTPSAEAADPLGSPKPLPTLLPSPDLSPLPTLLPSPSPTPTATEAPSPTATPEPPPGIELPELRSENSRTYLAPDGLYVTDFYSRPIHYHPVQADGTVAWEEIVPSFEVARYGPDGDESDTYLVSEHAQARVTLAAADSADGFIRLEGGGHTISFHLPAGVLPGREGVHPERIDSGRHGEIYDFLPGGIDLRVFPLADGAKSWLVFHEPPLVPSFSFLVNAPGLELKADPDLDNALIFVDGNGATVGRIPQPYMVDSSNVDELGGGALSVDVTLTIEPDLGYPGNELRPDGAYVVTLAPDPLFLQTATYPVYLDPTVVDFPNGGGAAHDTHATDGYPNKNFATYCRPDSPYYCEWTIGRWPGYSYHSEAFIKFTGVATALSSVEIEKAELRFFPYWQYFHYQWRPSWVERITQSWSATTLTWNSRPATVDDLDVGYLESHEGKWASLDVTDHYQRVVNGTLPEHGFKIHATGTPKGNWKRVISREQSSGSMADKKPVLRITWSPFGAAVPAHPIGGGPSGSRTLSWSHHAAAVQSAYQVQLSASTSFASPLADSGSQNGAAGSWAIPAGVALTEGTTYYWRVRAKWGTNTAFSAWSTIASFIHRPATNLGLAGHNSFESFDLGNGDSLSVNVANGNAVLSAPLVSLPYRGGALALGLVYNSHDTTNVGMGTGWRLSAMRRLTELANGDVVYVESDGSRHTFTKSGTAYTRPPTLYATLTKSGTVWTLTWRDLSLDTFTAAGSEGLLTRAADRHGNGIDFSYYGSSNRLYRATDAAGRYVEFTWDTGASPARLSSFTDWAYVSGGEVQATSTGSRRLYRFFYDAGGALIGWANPKNTSGACPTSAEHRTCLAYTGGLLTAITKRQVPAAIASGSTTTGTARDITTSVAYAGAMVTEVRDPEQAAPGSGTTFKWTGTGKLRAVRPGSPASTTTYGQVGATTDPLGRVESVWRKLGSAEIEQRTAWHATFPVEPASATANHGDQLKTPARTVTYTYIAGSLGLLATLVEPLTGSTSRTSTYTYNSNNDVTSVVTSSGSSSTTTRYCYATSGCSTSGAMLTMRARIDNYQGTGAKGGTNGHVANVTTEYLYDSFGQLTRETRFNYAPGGTLLDQRAIGYEYDALGNLTREIVNYADGAVTGGSDVTPDATTNARTDLTTIHTYDTAGNRISSADPRRAIGLAICAGTIRANDFVTRSAYDPSNLRIRETSGTTLRFSPCSTLPADGRTATYAYDAQGRLRSATDFGGLVTASVYDRAGRVLESLEDPPGSGTSELAVKTSVMTYDAGGRLKTAKDRRQLASSALGYTEYEYDALGRQTSVTEAKGVGTGIEVTTTSAHDALDRQTQLVYGGLATNYRYDLGGRVTEQDDGFTCTRTSYDYRDLATTVIEGLASGTSACSGAGLRTLTNTYDGLGRLTESRVSAGEGMGDIPSQASFDAAGNTLSSASLVGGTASSSSYTLNILDQLTRELRSDGSVNRTSYDAAGNPTDACYWATGTDEACKPVGSSFTSQPTRHTTSAYDARNARIALTDAATSATTTYDPDHNYQVSAVYLPTANGRELQTIHEYDERHRLVSLSHQLCNKATDPDCTAATALGSSTYAYDVNDNRTQVVEAHGATSSDRRYCYDAQNRLVTRRTGAACTSSPDETYEYDAAGNRTKAVAGGTTTSFAFNADGQLSSCSPHCGATGSTNVTYDKAGRTRQWNGWWFSYDPDGRLTKACRDSGCIPSADRVTFTYDAEGRRTSITTAPGGGTPTTIEFRYQGTAVVEERNAATDTLLRSYVVDEAGSIVKLIIPAGQTNAGTYMVSWNGHGDATALYRQLSGGSLELANSFTYTTWGQPTTDGSHTNSVTSQAYGDLGFRYLYVGQFGVQWDNFLGLGLHYMQARHYSPALGRFVQPDPAALETNWYSYVGNRPITKIDPSGLMAEIQDSRVRHELFVELYMRYLRRFGWEYDRGGRERIEGEWRVSDIWAEKKERLWRIEIKTSIRSGQRLNLPQFLNDVSRSLRGSTYRGQQMPPIPTRVVHARGQIIRSYIIRNGAAIFGRGGGSPGRIGGAIGGGRGGGGGGWIRLGPGMMFFR